MTFRAKIIQEIISKMENIPDTQLEQLLAYVEKIENLTDKKKSILSFAGSWKDIDQDLFEEFINGSHRKN
ncbi:MAG: hypothetical protein AAGG75_28545 [Bacteroidota bacterium]